MRDRSCDDPSGPADADGERRRLVQRTGGNPIVILDLLRASLRIQLAFKDDYERCAVICVCVGGWVWVWVWGVCGCCEPVCRGDCVVFNIQFVRNDT